MVLTLHDLMFSNPRNFMFVQKGVMRFYGTCIITVRPSLQVNRWSREEDWRRTFFKRLEGSAKARQNWRKEPGRSSGHGLRLRSHPSHYENILYQGTHAPTPKVPSQICFSMEPNSPTKVVQVIRAHVAVDLV